MLAKLETIHFLGVDDLEAARDFYANILGLTLAAEEDYALVFEAGGRTLRISSVQDFRPQPFTVFGWRVDTIAIAVKDLMEKGVTFNNYEQVMGIEQDELEIWHTEGAKVAWFNDRAGNLLSLTEIL